MTSKGQIAEKNTNEHVLVIVPQGNLKWNPNFTSSYTHLLNTEARSFDHFLNFWNRASVCGWVWVCKIVFSQVCGQDEFSEYLLETRVLTIEDFNTYPTQIFCWNSMHHWIIGMQFIYFCLLNISNEAYKYLHSFHDALKVQNISNYLRLKLFSKILYRRI